MRTPFAVAAFLLLAAGCGDGGSGGDAGPVTPDAGPILDPALFDCTATGIPERASAVPVACALDPACLTPQVSAHRGAGGAELGRLAPENTLAAFRAAIALGVEYVETDPRPTADGVLINLHDPTVDRTTDGFGLAEEMTLAAVQALHIDAGELPGDFSCERVPTFLEVLETCRGRVVVLVDANKTDRVDLLVQAIRDADALDWAIFDTSSLDKIDQALAIEPGLHIMIRPDSVAAIETELDHFAPRLPVIVELDANTAAAGAPIVHARGSRVLLDVFVQDAAAAISGDPSIYEAILDDGVDILQSDRPDLVIEQLRRRGDR